MCVCVCEQKPPEKKDNAWGGWSSWGKSLLSSATSTVGKSWLHFESTFLTLASHWTFCFSTCLRTGQSVTSVKTKAGEALRLHRTSVGEEAQEQLDGEEERRVEGDDSGNKEDAGNAEATAATGKGVFSAITHAVQNTVSPDNQTARHILLISYRNWCTWSGDQIKKTLFKHRQPSKNKLS